ncbi:MAG: glycosyltransferase family 2 protein, partial [bacterium]
RPDYVRRSLEQIARQRFERFEVIVTDDSTTDAVENFIRTQSLQTKLNCKAADVRLPCLCIRVHLLCNAQRV